MKKLFKNLIKYFLKKYSWKIEKVVIPKEYNEKAPDQILLNKMRESQGILHVGAHRGSEAPIYEWFGKKVIWIEANPNIYAALKENLIKYKLQKAYCELLLDLKDKTYEFFISNNDGASSSIFEFGELIEGNNKIWDRKFEMKNKIKLKSNTLDNFILTNNLDIEKYNHWVVDVQGSELQFLKGAEQSINFCKSINIEISTGEVYKNGASWLDVKNFLNKKGLMNTSEPDKKHMDILFIRK